MLHLISEAFLINIHCKGLFNSRDDDIIFRKIFLTLFKLIIVMLQIRRSFI